MTDRPAAVRESDYQTIVVPEVLSDGSLIYVANHPELRGCRAQAETPEQALENLTEVFQSYVEHFAEHGLDLPQPQRLVVQTAVWRSVRAVMVGSGASNVQRIHVLPSVSIGDIGRLSVSVPAEDGVTSRVG